MTNDPETFLVTGSWVSTWWGFYLGRALSSSIQGKKKCDTIKNENSVSFRTDYNFDKVGLTLKYVNMHR